MEKGDIVECIDDAVRAGAVRLTKGKLYTLTRDNIGSDSLYVRDDSGENTGYHTDRFK